MVSSDFLNINKESFLVGNFGTMRECELTWRPDIEDQDEEANEFWNCKLGYENLTFHALWELVGYHQWTFQLSLIPYGQVLNVLCHWGILYSWHICFSVSVWNLCNSGVFDAIQNDAIRLLSDNKAALIVLSSFKISSIIVFRCWNSFQTIHVTCHCNITGNEMAYNLARWGSAVIFCGLEPAPTLSGSMWQDIYWDWAEPRCETYSH
jgi:hypothetical protein